MMQGSVASFRMIPRGFPRSDAPLTTESAKAYVETSSPLRFSRYQNLLPTILPGPYDTQHFSVTLVHANLHFRHFSQELKGGKWRGEARARLSFKIYSYFVCVLFSRHVLHVCVHVQKTNLKHKYTKLRYVVLPL